MELQLETAKMPITDYAIVSPTSSATNFSSIDHNHPLYLQLIDTLSSYLISLQLAG